MLPFNKDPLIPKEPAPRPINEGKSQQRPTPYVERSYAPKKPLPNREIFEQSIQEIEKGSLLFDEKSQISKQEIEEKLKEYLKNSKHIASLKKHYDETLSEEKIPEFIEKVKKMLPESFGGFIDKAEMEALDKKLYWESQHLKKEYKVKEYKRAEKMRKFLGEITGLK